MNVTNTVCAEHYLDVSITNVTDEGTPCTCLCDKLWTYLATPPPDMANLTIEQKVEIIVHELTVDKKNTTVSLRKYVSVMDYRPSAVGIGIVASAIILSVIVVIVIIDLSTIWHEILYVLHKVFVLLKLTNTRHKHPIAELVENTSEIHVSITTGDVLTTPDKDNNMGDREGDVAQHHASSQLNGAGWWPRERAVYQSVFPDSTRLDVFYSNRVFENT